MSASDPKVQRNALHSLLAALSFEPSPSTANTNASSRPKTTPDVQERSINSSKKKKKKQKPTVITHRHILHGTLDADGDVSHIFYDAHQEGDEGFNEFHTEFRRDSVTIPSIQMNEEDIEAFLQSSAEEEAVTTALQTRGGAAAVDKGLDPAPPPPPPRDLPLRFLRAGKGDPQEGLRRYQQTLEWRREWQMDTALRDPMPHFDLIQQHYPAYYHGFGFQGQPIFFECPPKTNLNALRESGVDVPSLLKYYATINEFGWQYLSRDDLQRSIYVIDLKGIQLGDFVGQVVDFVKKASALCSQHYPERAGHVLVIHVPIWFKVIWNVVQTFVDPVTMEKISILRNDKEIRKRMQDLIPPEHIPAEYGGPTPLGQSEEQTLLRDLFHHNNRVAKEGRAAVCGGVSGGTCPFCTWSPARSY